MAYIASAANCLLELHIFLFSFYTEAAILEDSAQIEQAIIDSHAPAIIENAASIARRSNRVLQVAQQEVDNSEDPLLQLEVTNASNNLKAGMRVIAV